MNNRPAFPKTSENQDGLLILGVETQTKCTEGSNTMRRTIPEPFSDVFSNVLTSGARYSMRTTV